MNRMNALHGLAVTMLLAGGALAQPAPPPAAPVAPAAPPAPAAPAEGTGTVKGKVTIEGTARGPVVVYVEEIPGVKATPAATPPRIVQRGMRFQPEVIVAGVGSMVEFPNEDKIYHNVFSVTPGNEFDLGLYRGGVSKRVTLGRTGEVDVYCNIHEAMRTKILAVPNDFHVEAGADGAYELKGLPAGTFTLVAWSADHEPVTRKVVVKAGGVASADYSLKRRPEKGHLNKNGEQYGRYK